MRVIVNELQMLKPKTGIGHYTAELLRCLRLQTGPDRIDGFPTGLLRRAAAASFQAHRSLGAAGDHTLGRKRRRRPLHKLRGQLIGCLRNGFQAFLDRRFYRACARGRYDLYHEPNYLPMPADCPTLATLHDLSVLLHPEWHPADRVKRFEKQFAQVLARCAHFLADTDSVRREVIKVTGTPADRVTRVYMGIRSDLQPLPSSEVEQGLARLGLPPRYLLCLGTIEPRKNILRLLRAYCTLPDTLREACPLLLVGGWGWNTTAIRDYLHTVARHRGVRHLGYVADEHVPLLYNGARALLFPSHYEGFGLPPLEMMACGGAVIASTAAALRETVSGQAHLIDPEDDDGWRAALRRVIRDDDWWQSLRCGAEAVARPFTWERCAAETLSVYRRLCGVMETAPARRAAG